MSDLTVQLRHAKRNNETKLDLSTKNISFIPNEIYSLTNLQILNLSKNRISSIDAKIESLVNLKSLDLSDNSLMQVPPEIMRLPKLQVFVVSGNPLIKKFEPLQGKDCVGPKLQRVLKSCFGLESEEEPSANKPSWLEAEGEQQNSSKVFSKIIEIETLYKNQQAKVRQLEKELEKLSLHSHSSSKKSAMRLDPHSVLEIGFQELRLGEQISQGGFSVIHEGEYKGLPVAIKKVFNPNITEELLAELGNEVNMLAKFRHPNIILMVGICSLPPNLCIVMQYMPKGSLYDLLYKQKAQLKDSQRAHLAKQIIDTIYYLHSHGVVHRDIKSHNFLVGDGLSLKLCDFGLARQQNELNTGAMQFSGTPIYMAPELFMKKGYDASIDVFALGTLLWELYTREIPYHGLDPADIKEKVLKDPTLQSKPSLKKSIHSLINKCRDMDPAKRPTMKQLHEFSQW